MSEFLGFFTVLVFDYRSAVTDSNEEDSAESSTDDEEEAPSQEEG